MSLTRRGASCMVLCMDQVCRPGPGAAPRRRSGSWGGDQLACCAHPDVERCPHRRGHVAPKHSETVWRDWVGPFLPAGPSTEDVLRLVGSWMREDFRTARRHLIRRTITGSVVGPYCYFEGLGPVHIGRDSLIGPGSTFLTSHHAVDAATGEVSRVPEARPIVVGDRVWLGAR